MRILFVTWDGPGLAYLESLFLPIFQGLRASGFAFDVLQFRWGDPSDADRIAARCRTEGIGYRAIPVHRWGGPAGPTATALAGGRAVRRAIAHFGSEAVMPRSILPSVAALAGGAPAHVPIIYDADGLELDERVEFAGLAAGGPIYRLLRMVEARIVRRAGCVITRTQAAQAVLRQRARLPTEDKPMFVVTNGRDPNTFHPFSPEERSRIRDELSLSHDGPLIVYAGSVGFRYDTARIGALALAARARRPDTRLLVLSGSPDAARRELRLAGSPELAAMTTILSVPPPEVPRYLAAGDLGTAYVRTSFSTCAVAPVKVGEYLLCGVPIVGAAQVGNNDLAVQTGIYLDAPTDVERAADWLVDEVLPAREQFRQRARQTGLAEYSLQRSVEDYSAALGCLFDLPSPQAERPLVHG